MPATSKEVLKRVLDGAKSSIDGAKKRAKLPSVTFSTRLFYYIVSKLDQGDKKVKDICLPEPKAILDVKSVEYAIPGLKVPETEEGCFLDLYVEKEEEEEEIQRLSDEKKRRNEVWGLPSMESVKVLDFCTPSPLVTYMVTQLISTVVSSVSVTTTIYTQLGL